ncbi:hypothetical protein AB6T38_14765 [Aliiglaciecola sp. SL4]|uniref:hypothetical protein n=1 Tax=Aliiglaciecola sp. SL4 TaxID=3239806 RepID=UPI00355C1C31
MTSENSNQDDNSFMHFAALKTAIVNGEEQSVKELLSGQPMQALEKSYLMDLANLNNNSAIRKLLENIPVKE